MRFPRPFLPFSLLSGAEGGLNLTGLGQSEIKGRVKERRVSFPDSLFCKPRENRAGALIKVMWTQGTQEDIYPAFVFEYEYFLHNV